MSDYKDWGVWRKSMELVEEVYRHTKTFPKEELHGLTSQMRRAAVSIPSNIAEGHARISKNDRLHFFRIAFASSKELETQIEICRRLGYIQEVERKSLDDVLIQVIKMLATLVFSH